VPCVVGPAGPGDHQRQCTSTDPRRDERPGSDCGKDDIVTETSAESREKGRADRKKRRQGNPVSRLVRSVTLFVSQILDELRKVVRPTGPELLNYTGVVIVFVLVIMGIVTGLDFLFHKVVLLALAG